MLAITKIGTSSILASLNNCFRIEAAEDNFFISDASTTNNNKSVSCKKAVQYFLVASEPPTNNKTLANNYMFDQRDYIVSKNPTIRFTYYPKHCKIEPHFLFYIQKNPLLVLKGRCTKFHRRSQRIFGL